MSHFHREYLVMLRRQVDEEIIFLNGCGHSDKNSIPCMFCQPVGSTRRQGDLDYRCARLKALREFQSQIAHEEHKIASLDKLERESRFPPIGTASREAIVKPVGLAFGTAPVMTLIYPF